MVGDISAREIELLNAYQVLGQTGRKDLKDYMRFLLCKQYKREVMVSVFHNNLLHNLFHSLLHMIEREDIDLDQVRRRIIQIRELYYAIFEQVHNRYAELVEELDSNELVKEFGRTSFDNVERAIRIGSSVLVRAEILGFYQEFNNLGKKKDARKIVAV